MPRVSIWLPADLHADAKGAGLPISELAQEAVRRELQREQKRRELDVYLDELEKELGPSSAVEIAEAETWVDRLAMPPQPRTKRRSA